MAGGDGVEDGGFAPRCISIDLEVGVRDSRIHSFAAVRGDTGKSFVFQKGSLAEGLARLDAFAEGAAFVLGHNLTGFDIPHLSAAKPDLRLLKQSSGRPPASALPRAWSCTTAKRPRDSAMRCSPCRCVRCGRRDVETPARAAIAKLAKG